MGVKIRLKREWRKALPQKEAPPSFEQKRRGTSEALLK